MPGLDDFFHLAGLYGLFIYNSIYRQIPIYSDYSAHHLYDANGIKAFSINHVLIFSPLILVISIRCLNLRETDELLIMK